MRLKRLLAALTDRHLAWCEHPLVRRVLVRAAGIVLPLRLNPERARGLDINLEVRLRRPDRTEPDVVAIAISRGRCRVRRGSAADPAATVTTTITHLVRLAAGTTSVLVLWVGGELLVTGDTSLVRSLPGLFSGRR